MKKVREHRDDLVRRLPFLQVGFAVITVLIGTSYWFVQVVQGSYFRELAENNRLRKVPVKAPRGLIYDRSDHLLVDNVPSYELMLNRSVSKDVAASLDYASRILGTPVEQLEQEVDRKRGASRFKPILIAEDLSLSQVARFSVQALEHPEFEIRVGHLRVYRHGQLAAHLLGYLGEATEQELSAAGGALRGGDLVGRKGAEQAFDRRLRGQDGERVVVVDSRGRRREELGTEMAAAGSDLRLTLDLELQQEAARYFQERVGAAIALDPRSGEILALVSAPSFDSNHFARRLDREQWEEILEAPHDPLQNRALQNEYSPGSLFKIVVAVAGLEERIVNERDTVYCSGSTKIYNRRFRCWKRSGHGRVNLKKSIKDSCDVYFYHLGQKLGISRIAYYARLFGLGEATGIDMPSERTGLVPSLEWSLERRGTTWYPGETISVAIGQGPLLVTPLQMATMMATVANGGKRVTPHLALGGGGAAWAGEDLPVSPRSLEAVREALLAVVNERGTGAQSKLAGLDIAGKTGTVQVVEQKTWVDSKDLPFEKRDHAWFASFGPFQSPQLAVVVFVEHGGKGSEQAAPLAKILYEKHFGAQRPADGST